MELQSIKEDKECFAKAVMEIKDHAYIIAYSYLGDESSSMDVVCDAVEKAFFNVKKLNDPCFFKTWFIRIVINECKKHLRKKRYTNFLENTFFNNSPSNYSREDIIDVNNFLRQLPPLDRSLLYMKFYLGYTLDEISQLTEIPINTIKSKVYRGLKKLREDLKIKEA